MHVISTGMVSPAGLDARSACAAIRAGISTVSELPFHNDNGEPIIGASIQGFDFDLSFEERVVELLVGAISDCLRQEKHADLRRIPLLVGFPEEERPGVPVSLGDSIIAKIQERMGARFHSRWSHTQRCGHTSGFRLLRTARELLSRRDVGSCLVCGVDSYLVADSLRWLQMHWRLKTTRVSDGVIPGEASAALFVTREPPHGNSMKLVGLGVASEEVHVLSEEPLLAMGLTEATKQALDDAGLRLDDMDFRISDLTGESYGFREHALVMARLQRAERGYFPHLHIADSIGDTGAAAGVSQMVISFDRFTKSAAFETHAICFTSSVKGDRAVGVIEAMRPDSPRRRNG